MLFPGHSLPWEKLEHGAKRQGAKGGTSLLLLLCAGLNRGFPGSVPWLLSEGENVCTGKREGTCINEGRKRRESCLVKV